MFRRSGSAVCYFVEGKVADVRGPAFLEALAKHRFRDIQNAASEEVSVGWVTPADPTGNSFDLEDMDLDVGIWLRVRLDKKSLPGAWLKIHRAAAERSAGRKLSVRERRELAQDLASKLLPRVLPTVALVDALYEPKRGTILLFGTSKRVREEFHKLFFKTFGIGLIEGEPGSIARRCGLDAETWAYLDEVAPVPWPRAGSKSAPPEPRAAAAARAAVPEVTEVSE